MKRLTLIRHAKSSWDDDRLGDHERPLNPRGLRDAPVMGQRLKATGETYDGMFCSSANRARTTAETIARELDRAAPEVRDELYTFNGSELLGFIQNLDRELERVAVVGHNPATTSLVGWLCGADIDNVPTCGVVRLQFDLDDWTQIGEGSGVLVDFDYPKRTG